MALAREFGIERLGFLTLTFAEHVTCIEEANRRFNSLATGVLRGRYRRAIAVRERQDSGRLHFHLVVVLDADIRTGVDFDGIAKRNYGSAGDALRSEWAFWRATAPKYHFGRTELLPVKSNAEGIARYVGSYIGEHVRNRLDQDKGARLVSYLGYGPGDRKASSQFSWATDRGWMWRQKVGAFLRRFGLLDTAALRGIVGCKWAFLLEEEIWHTALAADAVVYPSKEVAENCMAIAAQGEWLREAHAICPVTIGCVGTRGAEAMNLLRRFQVPMRPKPKREFVELPLTGATRDLRGLHL
jgi:hypothetical protein